MKGGGSKADRDPKVPMRREDAAAWAEAIRGAGGTVVFTNGCFDLLHPGHVHLLERAAAFGDVLIVGLNSDDSVRRLKGPSRPLLDLEHRAFLLRAVRWVDGVVPFEEDTPLALIRAIRPDVLVKGGDYAAGEVVGRAEVEAAGGRVEIVPFLAGFSTSRLLDRLGGGAGNAS